MQAGGKKLRAEHTEVVFNLQHLGFGVEVVNPGHLDATGGDAESIVLDDLKLVTERCAGDREPYRSCVCGVKEPMRDLNVGSRVSLCCPQL